MNSFSHLKEMLSLNIIYFFAIKMIFTFIVLIITIHEYFSNTLAEEMKMSIMYANVDEVKQF